MLRIENDALVFLDDVYQMESYTELLGHPQRVVALGLLARPVADGVGVALYAETREEVQPLHPDSLLENQLGCEHRIEPPGDKRHCFSLGVAHGAMNRARCLSCLGSGRAMHGAHARERLRGARFGLVPGRDPSRWLGRVLLPRAATIAKNTHHV